MSDKFYFLGEPLLSFNSGQVAEDPRDGLALFGPTEAKQALPDSILIGNSKGIGLWENWCDALNSPANCIDINRQRPWPPYPGYEVAFGTPWPNPKKTYEVNTELLEKAAFKSDKYERAYSVANLYLEPMEKVNKLDAKPGIAICVVPDAVYDNCRPQSYVQNKSDIPKTKDQQKYLNWLLNDRRSGQTRMLDDQSLHDPDKKLEQYGLSPDFRRQLKSRTMRYDIPVQIIRESTLNITSNVRYGEPGVNPLSDRLWNFGTALFYQMWTETMENSLGERRCLLYRIGIQAGTAK